MCNDIIFKTEEYVFSYRVAGLLLHNGKVLLQRSTDDTSYAIPGDLRRFKVDRGGDEIE